MPDPTLSQAIREAYAAAPSDVVILHTLELRHPAFVNDDESPTAIRVVRDHRDLEARLEASAPVNGGKMVTFIALAFDLSLPPTPVPEITVTLDNVSREIVRHLDLSTDLEGPQMDPPITLVLTEVEANTLQVTGRARMLDIGNKAFPSETYTAKRFPGLTR